MNFEEIQRRTREVFRQEATDLLIELEAALLALESDVANDDAINRVFRAMHTLKGSGATSGFAELSDFVHHVEDVYNAAREGRLRLDSRMIDLTLKITDTITRYLDAPAADAAAVLTNAQDTLTALLACLPAHAAGPAKATAPTAGPSGWKIRFQPVPNFFQSGSDPALFLDDLRALGPCEIRALTTDLPPLAAMDPELSYLAWEIELAAPVAESAVRDVFTFVTDECKLDLTPCALAPAVVPPAPERWRCEFTTTAEMLAAPGLLETLWLDLGKLGPHQVLLAPADGEGKKAPGFWRLEITTTAGIELIRDAFAFMMHANPKITPVSAAGIELSLAPPQKSLPVAKPAPAPEERDATAPNAAAAVQRQPDETLRVSSRKLDHLVNLVGELVILRSQLHDACGLLPEIPAALQGVAEGLQRLTSELRDVVLDVRMMPIGDTFNKFQRLTRDMSRELGKEVDLVIQGADTEMDKTVLDQLADPLVHLVRNCLDHGLEPAAQRVAAGKPARGTLRLSAEQKGDRVWLTVADDGRGLSAAKIRAKAIDRGLLAASATPTEAELFQMIFLPGFSTAEVVSKVSGRGVGLDVVKKRIELLRGTVELTSRPGQGTEIRLSLPLTLAIIEGLMVGVDGDRYIMPLSAARETIEITRAQRSAGNGRNLVALRGELIPYLRLRDLFGFTSAAPEVERVVIIEFEDKRIGLVVDEVLGNHQTVLKTLGWLSQRVKIFSGSTVLGNGRAALIFDIAGLVAFSSARQGAAAGLEV